MSGDQINIGSLHGSQNQIGGRNNVIKQPSAQAPAREKADSDTGGPPANALYAFGDIVGYSRFSARLQEESQDQFVRALNSSLAEAGIEPGQVMTQDQGDARLLGFPADADVARIIALMPRRLNGELHARNQDMAMHAHLRVRLSFTMGPAVPGSAGMAGEAPIAAVRLANSAGLRSVMAALPQADCGVIIDSFLYHGYVRQAFRPDMNPEEYVRLLVSDPGKGFEAQAWIRLFSCPPQQVAALVS